MKHGGQAGAASNGENKKPSSQDHLLQAPSISLPKGGGAIKSIDEKFSINSFNGTSSFSIPLPFSAARGSSPALSLSYNSGGGNGIFGLGWSLSIPSIRRKTEKELPRYQDTIDSDTYVLAGAEDLVPVLKKNGDEWIKDGRTNADYDIRYYRPRAESLFARIERWTKKSDGIIHWRIVSKDNSISILGQSGFSRIADPNNTSKIFEWFPEFTHDDKHNCTEYEYVKENSFGAPVDSVHQRNRTNGLSAYTNLYLKRVRYGNRNPYLNPGDPRPASTGYLFETVFDFGEHASSAPCELIPGQNWLHRTDAFSEYRSGFEIRTNRLCKAVFLFHRNFELADLPGGEALVKAVHFDYDDNGQNGFTFLKQIHQTGYTKHDEGHYTQKSLPPFEFGYQSHAWNTSIKNVSEESLLHAPSGMDESQYQWQDLYSEGISGLLSEQANGFFYKSNLGGGNFSEAKLISLKPSFSGLGSMVQIRELDANGIKQLVQLGQQPKGFFELSGDENWQHFTPFKNLPNIDFHDPNLKQVDLDGDGIPDLLISEEQVFRWYPSKGKIGYDSAELVLKSPDEEQGPTLVFADETQSIFMADMSGDGMTDILRIRNGEVCYWPNLGYGRFGAKVSMDRSPHFDTHDQFDPHLVRLADIDGSGTTDIIYLGKNEFRVWMNLHGNGFAAAYTINPFPEIDNFSAISVLDFLGTGTACIVWNSALPKNSHAPLRYIDLMSSCKPHLMTVYKNNMGKEVHIEYNSSVHYYLADKKNGTPWITKLPFPVLCVSKTIVYDRIRKTRFASEYNYHHGYYDSIEREFRGFGRIDQTDAEQIDHFVKESSGMSNNILEQDLHQPPVITKSWFHTGFFMNEKKILDQYAHEYYQNTAHPENLLPQPYFTENLSAEEFREALRSCKGTLLRKEVFALDSSADQDKPYAVEQHNPTIKRLQEKAINKHAVFLVHESESILYQYERNMADPRIAHSFVLKIDAYGNALQTAAVGYGRFTDDAELNASQQAEQKKIQITCNENEYTEALNADDQLRSPLPWRNRGYEIVNMPPPVTGSYYSFDEIFNACADAPGKTIDYHEAVSGTEIKKRLIELVRIQYRGDDGIAVLPFGISGFKGLLHETSKTAFTPELLQNIFNPLIPYSDLRERLTRTDLNGGGGYLLDENYFWIRSGTQDYDALHFYQSTEFRDSFDQRTLVEYDPVYRLFPIRTVDAIGNETRVLSINYRTLTPVYLQDSNGNRAALRTDEFGMISQTFVIGKETDEGDVFDHTKKEKSILDQPGSELNYFSHEWYNQSHAPGFDIGQPYKPRPNYSHTKNWEVHYKANPARSTEFKETYSYSDGGGQIILTKIPAEPGEALQINPDGTVTTIDTATRWTANGRTVLNNKGKPVKQYEPYFSINPFFDDEKEMVELGVSPVIHYDAIGRCIRTDFPDGTFSEVRFDSWKKSSYDQNDTVLRSEWLRNIFAPAIPPGEGDPLPLAATPQQKAAWLAIKHAETPAVTHLDARGQEFLSIADNKTETFSNQSFFDSEGNLRRLTDPMGRNVMLLEYDMLGDTVFQQSMDAGKRWILKDAVGKPLISWDEKGNVFHNRYDALHRLLEAYVSHAGDTFTSERFSYGEESPFAIEKNLRGKAWKHYDQAGIITQEQIDFKGNLLRSTRQLCRNYKTSINWQDITAVPLEPEIFETGAVYDALNRPIKLLTPHTPAIPANEIIPLYNEAGMLDRVDVKLRGAGTATNFIRKISHNAKGQRTLIRYGNQTQIRYTYDRLTSRLTNTVTVRTRDSVNLQDLHYVFDPAGNITQIHDAAQSEFIHLGVQIKALNEYTYDALYRLSSASGREHRGQCLVNHDGPSGNFRNHPFVPFSLTPGTNEAEAFRNYIESYLYDAAGNLKQQKHDTTEATTGWVRTFQYGKTAAGLDQNNRLYQTESGSFNFIYGNEEDGSYDAHGNMQKMEHLAVMDWNFKDYFAHTRRGTTDTYYVYDSSGERIRKVQEDAPGRKQKERLYFGSFEIYREYTVSGEIKTERESLHIVDDKRRIAMVETLTVKNSIVLSSPEILQRYQYDNHLGSASLELDDTGALISYEEYFPFGTSSYCSVDATREVPEKRYRYTGKERDDETGLNYHNARYYAPWLCRWTAADPAGVKAGLNLFVYVSNNPITKTDPSGLDEITIFHRTAQRFADSMVRTGAQVDRSLPHVWGGGGFYGVSVPNIPDHFVARSGSEAAQRSVVIAQRISTNNMVQVTDPLLLRIFEDTAAGREVRSELWGSVRDNRGVMYRNRPSPPTNLRDFMTQRLDELYPNAEVVSWRNPNGTTSYIVRRQTAILGRARIAGRIRDGVILTLEPTPAPTPGNTSGGGGEPPPGGGETPRGGGEPPRGGGGGEPPAGSGGATPPRNNPPPSGNSGGGSSAARGGTVAEEGSAVVRTVAEEAPVVITRFERFTEAGRTLFRGTARVGGRVLFFVGIAAGTYLTITAIQEGDYPRAALEVVSMVPQIGMARLAAEVVVLPTANWLGQRYQEAEREAWRFFGL